MVAKFSVKYFSSIEWRWQRFLVLAKSLEQVQEMVDKDCAKMYRNKPFQIKKEDSLEIENLGELTLPYVVNGYDI